jgi:hypothetical protein
LEKKERKKIDELHKLAAVEGGGCAHRETDPS